MYELHVFYTSLVTTFVIWEVNLDMEISFISRICDLIAFNQWKAFIGWTPMNSCSTSLFIYSLFCHMCHLLSQVFEQFFLLASSSTPSNWTITSSWNIRSWREAFFMKAIKESFLFVNYNALLECHLTKHFQWHKSSPLLLPFHYLW